MILNNNVALDNFFVWSKKSVTGLTKLLNLVKNFIVEKVAESGFSLRNYPFESIIEKEFTQFEQDLLKKTLRSGVFEGI